MPRETLSAALLVAAASGAVLASALAAPPAFAEDPHGHRAPDLLTLSDLTPEQRHLAEDAFGRVVCACPNENWSKTLAMCPDGCAVPQKQMIMTRIREGWPIAQIVAEQVQEHGPKAAAAPGTSRDGTWLVVAGVAAAAVVAGVVLASWSASATRRRTAPAPADAAGGDETDAVERELREID